MPIDRRVFLASLGVAAAAPAILRAQGTRKRYPLAFSTLGCPAWPWKTVLEQADKLGYAALELRGIAGEMDLTKVPELTGTQRAGTMKDLAALGIVDLRPRRVLEHAREGRRRPREAARRGPALHRPRAGPGREVRADVREQHPAGRAARGRDEARGGRLPDHDRVREAGRRHGADRVARRLHALEGPRRDPDPRRLAAVRAAVGRPPLVRRRRRAVRPTATRRSASGSATRTSRTRRPRARRWRTAATC